MEPAWWIIAPVDSIAAIFPKASLRSILVGCILLPKASAEDEEEEEARRYVESYSRGLRTACLLCL